MNFDEDEKLLLIALSWTLAFVVMVCGIIYVVNPEDVTEFTSEELKRFYDLLGTGCLFFFLTMVGAGIFVMLRDHFNGKK